MENRRRQNWDNHRRSQNKKPPRRNSGSWQPTVPSWEKEFCRVIGSIDWETLLQMKKFTHLYENVIKWDDSAGKEAFLNAKKRFWAETNGLLCDISLPDPDLYIDKIDWDSETNSNSLPDLEVDPTDTDHDPVIIFGDSLLPNEAYSVMGWGDEDEKFKAPANHGSPPPWVEKSSSSFDKGPTTGWPIDGGRPGSGPGGYATWGGGWNNNTICQMQPRVEHEMGGQRQQSGMDRRLNGREWNSFNSYGPTNHHATITVGQTWNR